MKKKEMLNNLKRYKRRKRLVNDKNFNEFFFDVAEHGPKPGQVMACWRAVAELVDGDEKRSVVNLLCENNLGADMAVRVLTGLCSARERDAVRAAKEMSQDLLSGMTREEVLEKPYRLVLEKFFYTWKKYVPDDPHWQVIKIVNAKVAAE